MPATRSIPDRWPGVPCARVYHPHRGRIQVPGPTSLLSPTVSQGPPHRATVKRPLAIIRCKLGGFPNPGH